MTSETSMTGRLGNFSVESSRVARSTQWVVSPKMATSSEWGDSDSGGYTNRAAGRKDATFTSEGKYDTGAEQFDLFQPGDILKAILWMNTTLYWAFPRALNSDFQMTVNMDTQEVIGWTASWGADGIYYRPGQSGAPTETLPA
jgi:hypothetical protein